jgi:UDP-GlcNAc:undecaprenyl-phosphate GlcNAc-1-phosphate transferase
MNFVNFEIILFSSLCALVLGPINSALAKRVGLVDIPGSEPHKKGNRRVPLAGGPVLAETLLIVGLATGAAVVSDAWRILAASGIVFVFGVWDDFRPLPPLVKLAGQILASVALLVLGISVTLFGSPVLNVAVTILWMVTLTNAFNFVDSMDGLAAGLAALASAFFMLVSSSTSQPRLAEFGALLLGSCAGCL